MHVIWKRVTALLWNVIITSFSTFAKVFLLVIHNVPTVGVWNRSIRADWTFLTLCVTTGLHWTDYRVWTCPCYGCWLDHFLCRVVLACGRRVLAAFAALSGRLPGNVNLVYLSAAQRTGHHSWYSCSVLPK